MRKCLLLSSLVLIILFFAGYALAGDTVTIRVSCSIPAIPGVNAPPLDSKEETIEKEVAEEKVEKEIKEKKEG